MKSGVLAKAMLLAGLFTGGDKPLSNGETLNVSYSLSMFSLSM